MKINSLKKQIQAISNFNPRLCNLIVYNVISQSKYFEKMSGVETFQLCYSKTDDDFYLMSQYSSLFKNDMIENFDINYSGNIATIRLDDMFYFDDNNDIKPEVIDYIFLSKEQKELLNKIHNAVEHNLPCLEKEDFQFIRKFLANNISLVDMIHLIKNDENENNSGIKIMDNESNQNTKRIQEINNKLLDGIKRCLESKLIQDFDFNVLEKLGIIDEQEKKEIVHLSQHFISELDNQYEKIKTHENVKVEFINPQNSLLGDVDGLVKFDSSLNCQYKSPDSNLIDNHVDVDFIGLVESVENKDFLGIHTRLTTLYDLDFFGNTCLPYAGDKDNESQKSLILLKNKENNDLLGFMSIAKRGYDYYDNVFQVCTISIKSQFRGLGLTDLIYEKLDQVAEKNDLLIARSLDGLTQDGRKYLPNKISKKDYNYIYDYEAYSRGSKETLEQLMAKIYLSLGKPEDKFNEVMRLDCNFIKEIKNELKTFPDELKKSMYQKVWDYYWTNDSFNRRNDDEIKSFFNNLMSEARIKLDYDVKNNETTKINLTSINDSVEVEKTSVKIKSLKM